MQGKPRWGERKEGKVASSMGLLTATIEAVLRCTASSDPDKRKRKWDGKMAGSRGHNRQFGVSKQ